MEPHSTFLRLLVLALLVTSIAATALADDDIPAWASESTDIYYKANAQGDAVKLGSIYSPEAIIYVSPEDPGNTEGKPLEIKGRNAIVEFFRQDFRNMRYDCEWELTQVLKSKNLAAVSGHDTCIEINLVSGEQKVVDSGEWVSIYKKHQGGKWLIIMEHY
jgi:ketosteroid isomerase-like protein